jgi:DNA transformation protein
MSTLHEMPNIGPVVEGKLIEADIDTPEMLKKIGSEEAFCRIKLKDSGACLHMLYALEGAVEGIPYQYLPDDKKQELKIFYKSLKGE